MIRLSAMGDVAMLVPVVLALIKAQPEIKITLISRSRFAPIFAGIGQVQFMAAEVNGKHKGVVGLWRLAKAIKKTNPDAVADLHHVLRSHVVRLFLKWSGLPVATLFKGRQEKQKITKNFDPKTPWLTSSHERYAAVFRSLGLTVDLTPHLVANHKVPKDDQATQLRDNLPRPLIGIAPFAAFPGKAYPEAMMRQLITEVSQKWKGTILLFGGPGKEQNTLNQWSQDHEQVRNCAGSGTFAQELMLLQELDVMIAMDSGNGHLAANFGLPVITLWGVTHPCFGFAPFAQPAENQLCADRTHFPKIPTSVYGKEMPEGYDKAMETIIPEMVINRLSDILDKTNTL